MSTTAFLSQTERWDAVRRREATADGVFIYAVRTTKIYCRPVCKARLAREANVVFYDTAEEAERANYRPCKRCKPDLAGRMPEKNAVLRVRAMVEQEMLLAGAGSGAGTAADGKRTPPGIGGLAEMARQAGLSKWHFHRVFKEVTSMTPTEYARQQSRGSTSYSISSLELGPSVSLPVSRLGSELLATDPVLDDLDFNFDDLQSYLDDNFFEELSRIPDEYQLIVPDPWSITELQDHPTGDEKGFLWDRGWNPDLVPGNVPAEEYSISSTAR